MSIRYDLMQLANLREADETLSKWVNFFSVYLFILREREKERANGGGAERGRENENLRQAPHSQHRAQCGDPTQKPWDHDPGRSPMLNWLSYPGDPMSERFQTLIILKDNERSRLLFVPILCRPSVLGHSLWGISPNTSHPCTKCIDASPRSSLDVWCALSNEPWVEVIYATSKQKFNEPLCGFTIVFLPLAQEWSVLDWMSLPFLPIPKRRQHMNLSFPTANVNETRMRKKSFVDMGTKIVIVAQPSKIWLVQRVCLRIGVGSSRGVLWWSQRACLRSWWFYWLAWGHRVPNIITKFSQARLGHFPP